MGSLLLKLSNYVANKPTLRMNCWIPTCLFKKSVNKATGLKSSNPLVRQLAEYTQQTVQDIKSPFVRLRFTRKVGETGSINNLRVSAGNQTLVNGAVSKDGNVWKVRCSAKKGKDFHVSGFVDEVAENVSNTRSQFSSMVLEDGKMVAKADCGAAGQFACAGKPDFVSRLLFNTMAVAR